MADTTNQASGSGNQSVGKVVILYGTVKAVATDGTERVLGPNSSVFFGDHIITGPDGMVSIVFDADLTQLDLGRMSDAFVDKEVAGGAPAAAEEMAAEVADIQQALAEGDIEQILDLPAPAAGAGAAGAGGGSHDYPKFDVDGDAVLPVFGKETTGITYTTLDPPGGGVVEEVLAVEPPPPPPPPPPPAAPTPPSGEGTSLLVDEAAIVDSDGLPTLSFTAGSDSLVSFVFSDDLSGLLTNTDGIGGDDVTWVRTSDTVIEGIIDGSVAITLTLSAPDSIPAGSTGTVTVTATLTGPFPHPPGGGAQTINVGSVNVIASEADGDSVEAPVFIAVIDDVPVVTFTAEPGVVEEEALDNYDGFWQGSDGNPDDTGDSEIPGSPDPTLPTVTGNLNISIDMGADTPGTTSFNINPSNVPILSSKGELVDDFQVTGGGSVLEAYSADGRLVYTLEVDASTGVYTFSLHDQLDHDPPAPGTAVENSLDIDFSSVVSISVTDADGDTATASPTNLVISVYDDIPVADAEAKMIVASVHEDGLSYQGDLPDDPDLSEGNREFGETVDDDEDSGSGNQSIATLFSIGADEHPVETNEPVVIYGVSQDPAALASLDAMGLTSQGDAVTFSSDGQVLTAEADGRTVFTLTVNPVSGDWEFDLDDQMDHVDNGLNNENWNLIGGGGLRGIKLDLSSVITVTDYDGDTVTAGRGTFVVHIQDDIPEISITQAEGETVTAEVLEDGLSFQDDPGDPDLSEGNRESGETVDDDETSDAIGGNLQGLFNTSFTVGADEPPTDMTVTVGLSVDTNGMETLYSQGKAITNTVTQGPTSDVLVGTVDGGATVVYTLEVFQDGSWTFDLDDQMDHVDDGQNDENTALLAGDDGQGNPTTSVNGIDFSSVLIGTVTGEDFDGDEVTDTTGVYDGTFVITVEDDIPGIDITQAEGETVTAEVLEDGLSRRFDPGDNDKSTGNRESGETVNDDETEGAAGSLTALFTADYDPIGADEPGTTPTITVGLSSDTSGMDTLYSKGEQLYYHVNDAGDTLIATNDADPDSTTARTVFTLNVNSDGSWDFDLDDQMDHVGPENPGVENWDLVSIDVTGAPTSVSGIDFSSVIVGTVTGTDFDGDAATDTTGLLDNTFVVNVQDDIPEIDILQAEGATVTAEVLEDGMSIASGDAGDKSEGNKESGETNADDETGGGAGSLTALFTADYNPIGADEPASQPVVTVGLSSDTSGMDTLYSQGEQLYYHVNDAGDTLIATNDADPDSTTARTVFTLNVNSDGSWDFDLDDQMDHVGPENPGVENWDLVSIDVTGAPNSVSGIDFSSVIVGTVTGTDFDGDAATDTAGLLDNTFVVNVQDDIPGIDITQAEGETVTAEVLEDGLSRRFDPGDNDKSTGNRESGETVNDDETEGAAGSLTALFTADYDPIGADEPGTTPTVTVGLSSDTSGMDTLYSQGEQLYYHVNDAGDTLIATNDADPDSTTARTVFTLNVNSDGSWDFDLDDQMDHVGPENPGVENWDLVSIDVTGAPTSVSGIDFSSVIVGTVTGTDFDGDAATDTAGLLDNTFVVNVQDDIPEIDILQAEGATVTAEVLEDGMSIASGDAGDKSEGNKESGETNADDETGGGAGSLTALFTADYNPIGADEPASQPVVTVGLSSDTSGMDTLYSQGEQLYYHVNDAGDTLIATNDADPDSTTARTVFTLNVNSDGSWDFDLDDQMDHVDNSLNDENWDLVSNDVTGTPTSVSGIDFSSVIVGTVTGTDFDGDAATDTTGLLDNTFVVNVQDDIPTAALTPEGSLTATVHEDGMSTAFGDPGDKSEGNDSPMDYDSDEASGTVGSLTSLFSSDFSIGADEGSPAPTVNVSLSQDISGLPDLYSKGEKLQYNVNSTGDMLIASTTAGIVFSLTVNPDGSWAFDLDDQLDHVDDGTNTENTDLQAGDDGQGNPTTSVNGIDFSSVLVGTVTGEDFDHDMVTVVASDASFVVNVVDDIPEIGTPQDSLLANTDFNSVTGSLDTSIGADEPGEINLLLTDSAPVLDTDGTQMTNNDVGLHWQDNGDGSFSAVSDQTSNGGSETEPSFTISVDESAGTYTVYMDNGLDGRDSTETIDFSEALNGGNTYQAVFGSLTATTTEVGTDVFYGDNGVYVQARASLDTGDTGSGGDFVMHEHDGLISNPDSPGDPSATVNYANQGVGVDRGAMVTGDDSGGDRVSEVLSIKFYSSIVVSQVGNSQDAVEVLDTYDPGTPGDPTDDYQSTVLDLTSVSFVIDHLGSAEDLYYAIYDDGVKVGETTVAFSGIDPGGGASAPSKDDLLEINAADFGVAQFDEVRFESGDGDWRIQSAEIETTAEGYDQSIEVPFEVVDADGDSVQGDFSVTFDGDQVLDATEADAADGDVSTNGMAISGDGAETIIGTEYDDTIDGGAGNDTIDGGGGDDTIFGGDGDDTIDGGAGNDTIVGGDGEDDISGGDGDDDLFGSDGNDTLDGGADNDTLVGGDDNDVLVGGTGDDDLFGGDETGADGAGTDTLTGDEAGDPTDTGSDNFADTGGDTVTDNDGAGDGDTMDDLVPPPEPDPTV